MQEVACWKGVPFFHIKTERAIIGVLLECIDLRKVKGDMYIVNWLIAAQVVRNLSLFEVIGFNLNLKAFRSAASEMRMWS